MRVRQAGEPGDARETATIEAPPPPRRPTRADIEEVQKQIDELLPQFSGSFRTRARSRANQLHQDLLEALRYDDEPKAIQRMAELRELLQQLESSKGQMLDPPWPRFAQLVRHCLELAAEVGRRRPAAIAQELFEHVHAQERYAEQAYEEHNQALYRECRRKPGEVRRLSRSAAARHAAAAATGAALPPEEEAKDDRWTASATTCRGLEAGAGEAADRPGGAADGDRRAGQAA